MFHVWAEALEETRLGAGHDEVDSSHLGILTFANDPVEDGL
jgi:hypothetical protein